MERIDYKTMIAYGFYRENLPDEVAFAETGYHPYSLSKSYPEHNVMISIHSDSLRGDQTFQVCEWTNGNVLCEMSAATMLKVLDKGEVFQLSDDKFVIKLMSEVNRIESLKNQAKTTLQSV